MHDVNHIVYESKCKELKKSYTIVIIPRTEATVDCHRHNVSGRKTFKIL